MRTYDFAPLWRSTIGFDRLFDLAETAQRASEDNYPPYNIERLGDDRYQISLAVPGFAPEDIVITAKQNDYVQAAKALGAGHGRILLRHIAPNAIAPVIVVATIALGTYISLEATLSYLGVGLKPPTVSWGIDISSASAYIRQAPHMLLWPAGALAITVLAFIMLGDAVRDALDPKLR